MKESEDVPVVLCGDLDCVGFGGGQREIQVGDDSRSVVSDSLRPYGL